MFKSQLKSSTSSSIMDYALKRQTVVFVLWVETGSRYCFCSDTGPRNKKGWGPLLQLNDFLAFKKTFLSRSAEWLVIITRKC